ncbi:hypothetical protein, partial [Mycobacterium sp.]|uniref:hypothetical protein n=1 Tax=Mycobacterium sp. TaxID=1785 RepID=UPI0031DACC85
PFKNLSFTVNGKDFYVGDYQYYSDIGFAYNNDEYYVFNMENETFNGQLKITIDKGLEITKMFIIGYS